MTGLSLAGRNERLADVALDFDTMSLHTGDPGDNGASEVAGGSPAYARIAGIQWNTPSAGSLVMSTHPLFNVPGGTTVTYVGFWKGTSFQGGYPLSQAQAFNYQGTLTFDTYTLNQPAV